MGVGCVWKPVNMWDGYDDDVVINNANVVGHPPFPPMSGGGIYTYSQIMTYDTESMLGCLRILSPALETIRCTAST